MTSSDLYVAHELIFEDGEAGYVAGYMAHTSKLLHILRLNTLVHAHMFRFEVPAQPLCIPI